MACIREDGTKITKAELVKFISLDRQDDWNTFDDYVESEIHTNRISFHDSSYAPDFKCSCSDFFKNYLCMHAIGLATLLDKFTLPEEAATGGLGIKRGPGRPKRNTKALQKLRNLNFCL